MSDQDSQGENGDVGAVHDIEVTLSVELGKTTMPIHQLLKLGRGAIVELDRTTKDACDVYVNDRLIAKGEVVIVEDRVGVTLTDVIKSESGTSRSG